MSQIKVTVTIEVDGVLVPGFDPLVLRQTTPQTSALEYDLSVGSAKVGAEVGGPGVDPWISAIPALTVIALNPDRALTVTPETAFYLNPGALFLIVNQAHPFGPPTISNTDGENDVAVHAFVGGGE